MFLYFLRKVKQRKSSVSRGVFDALPGTAIYSPAKVVKKQCTNMKIQDVQFHLFGSVMTEIITGLIDLFIKTCFNI